LCPHPEIDQHGKKGDNRDVQVGLHSGWLRLIRKTA
jgi:hypothetical protein